MKFSDGAVCVCGHDKGFHDGATVHARYPYEYTYWCCDGKLFGRCRCPRFRLALAQPQREITSKTPADRRRPAGKV